MTDALPAEVSAGPSSDALVEQSEIRPIDHKPIEAEPEPKAEPKKAEPKSQSEKREDATRKAVDKVLAEPKADDKAEPVKPVEEEQKADKKSDAAEPKEAEAEQKEAQKPRESAFREAPKRFDDAAKSEWESVPESVRGAIHRSQRELESGIEKYRGAAEEFEKVRAYADMAKQHGTDLSTALRQYVGIEQLLKRDAIAGLEQIVSNLGLKLNNGQPITLRHIAELYLKRSPEQNENGALNARMAMMEQAQKEQARQQQEAQAKAYSASLVEAAQKVFPRFEELRPVMLGLVQSGAVSGASDVEVMRAAYAEAERRFPATTGAHTAEPEALAQTQRHPNPAGRKAVSGSQSGTAKSSPKKSASRHDAIEKAMRAAGL